MPDAGRPYVTLLLRLWQVVGNGSPVWHASLESSQTGERHGFADLGALFTFLRDLTSMYPRPAGVETLQVSNDDA